MFFKIDYSYNSEFQMIPCVRYDIGAQRIYFLQIGLFCLVQKAQR